MEANEEEFGARQAAGMALKEEEIESKKVGARGVCSQLLHSFSTLHVSVLVKARSAQKIEGG